MTPEEKRIRNAEKSKRWRDRNPEAAKAAKKKYYASEKGKAQKLKEESAYKTSGKRAASEIRRSQRPLSEARKQARLRHQLMRRTGEKTLDEFDFLVLKEAVHLTRLRNKLCGGKWHVDHIIPISKGGPCSHDNLQVVPASWNQSKSNKHTNRFFN
jgi:CRISPR/Cas system Type II protein with McrA/HNH and RuvC-like nuclease domain